MRIAVALLCVLFLDRVGRAAEQPPCIDVEANGMIRALIDWPGELPIRAGVWVVRDDWKSIQQQWNLKDLAYSPFDTQRSIRGRFDLGDASLGVEEKIDSASVAYSLNATRAIDATGVYWFCEVPVNRFAGGTVVLGERRLDLPVDQPRDTAIGSGNVSTLYVLSKDRKTQIQIQFPAGREVRVQDARVFGEERYQIYTPLTEAPIAADAKLSFAATIHTQLDVDDSSAIVTIDSKSICNAFDGFGGNFVYTIDDPTTKLALDALKLSWARVGIEAAKWEPTNDNDDPLLTDADALAARDVEGSILRKRFELDRQLYKLADGRLIASLWYPPEWLYREVLADRNQPGVIERDRWDELAECIVSYLLHLKTRYGVEPALFSFNESDIGIYVLLDGSETRDLVKLLGQRFVDAGLRTKILLGDSADLEKGFGQIQRTLSDADAMKFVGAMSYHPWSGQNEWWDDWSAAAKAHSLPLLATEMGADSTAWQDSSFNSPLATVRLARKYIEQIRDARTQSLLEWEWTGDYAITTRGEKGELVLSDRGRFLQQLTQTTPVDANVVATQCDSQSITAATVMADDQKSAAVHLVNRGGARRVEVRGLPPSLTLATLFVIDPLSSERKPVLIEARSGACAFDVPAGAIATLAFPSID